MNATMNLAVLTIPGGKIIEALGLPADTVIRNCRLGDNPQTVEFVLENPAFPAHSPGDRVAQCNPQFRRRTNRPPLNEFEEWGF